MKVRTILLSMVLVAGVSLNVSAQFKIGGKSINTKKLVNAASDAAKAVTLSDEDVAAMAREYIQWMDTHNEIAGPETAMGQRLANLTKDIKVEGLDLNFKVYNVIDVNAFACGDGSVRVCGGLMKIMDDNEVLADSQLGSLAETLASAQYSQKQENAADDYGFEFSIANGIDPYSMYNSLNKLLELSVEAPKSSKFRQLFSSHPETQKRVKRMKEKADEYTKNQQ